MVINHIETRLQTTPRERWRKILKVNICLSTIDAICSRAYFKSRTPEIQRFNEYGHQHLQEFN